MGNFNQGGRKSGGNFGGGKSFGGGGNRFGGRDGGRPTMNKATCSDCGASCEVPFKPTGDRPVYCNSCFTVKKSGEGRPNNFGVDRHEKPRFFEKTGGSNNSGAITDQLKALNGKIDKLVAMLTPKTSVEKSEKSDGEKIVKAKVKGKAKIASKKDSSKKK